MDEALNCHARRLRLARILAVERRIRDSGIWISPRRPTMSISPSGVDPASWADAPTEEVTLGQLG